MNVISDTKVHKKKSRWSKKVSEELVDIVLNCFRIEFSPDRNSENDSSRRISVIKHLTKYQIPSFKFENFAFEDTKNLYFSHPRPEFKLVGDLLYIQKFNEDQGVMRSHVPQIGIMVFKFVSDSNQNIVLKFCRAECLTEFNEVLVKDNLQSME